MRNILFLLILVLCSCNTKETNVSQEQEKEIKITENEGVSVSTVVVEEQVFQKQIIANGTIEALKKTELRFKTSERIASLKVKNGDKVKKGQTLAVLDNAILLNDLNRATLDLDKAKSKLQEEKINYGVGSLEEEKIEAKVLKNLKIKSGYYEAQNALEKAQLLYNQTIVVAPFNGVVANIEVKQGNYITSADVFCSIVGQQQLEAKFSILENELPFVNKGQAVTVIPFANNNTVIKGRITEVNPIVDENGLIAIKARLETSKSMLFDGMHVKTIINKPIENCIVVPKQALVLRSNKEVVFTVEDGLAKWNYVELLDENSSSYAIKKGLKKGNVVIVSNNMNLSHDAKVKVKEN